ncbi:nuclear transport factor 2 family protein [Tsukamurella soli]
MHHDDPRSPRPPALDVTSARDFADSWLAAWNAHDLDTILAHFTDDARFTSPVAATLLPDTGGVLVGKAAIREYWTVGLERIPDLRFEIVAVYTGVDTVVINYRNHAGGLVCEVLRMQTDEAGPRVVRGDGTYPTDDAAAASGVD